MTILNVVCTLAICATGLSGVSAAIQSVNGVIRQITENKTVPQLQAMGVPVDLNGNTDVIQTTMFPRGLNEEPIRVEKKIYPNDPCPCGSGKKYKKCCGKKN